ncbi:T9SS type A sorting domain-containing protein [bacterium]
MIRQTLYGCLLAPLLIIGQVCELPAGSQGNQLILSVNNEGRNNIKDVLVKIVEIPDWLECGNDEVLISGTEPGEKQDVIFILDVQEGAADLHGLLTLSINDKTGKILATRKYSLLTVLTDDEDPIPAYPNPANPEVNIPFNMRESGEVRIDIYNTLGQRVIALVDEEKSTGHWQVTWNGRDGSGRMVSTGMYIIRLQTRIKGRIQHHTSKILLSK